MDVGDQLKIGRFDQVRLITTKNVSYLSAPPGTKASPQGIWSVVASVATNELLLAQNSILIRVPASDVLMVAGYDVDKITKKLGKLSNGEERNSEERSI